MFEVIIIFVLFNVVTSVVTDNLFSFGFIANGVRAIVFGAGNIVVVDAIVVE